MNVTHAVAAFALLSLAIAGCTPHRMYRPDNVQQEEGYTLSFIEFDDQGEPWSPLQGQRVIQLIERANRHPDGSVVVVFVHGWNNNASLEQERDPRKSLYGFKLALSNVVRSLTLVYGASRPPVVGVFVSWRGQSSYSIFKPFTFFGRRRTAARVAGPAATGTLFRIMSVAKENPKSRMLLVGHSFGGLMVEETVADVAAGLLLGSTRSEIDFPADLVVLINPASPSMLAKQFVDLLVREGARLYRVGPQGKRFERPLMVSITSRSDMATRTLFPTGQRLATLARRFRKYGPEFCTPATSQRSYQLYTAGHQTVLHSHELIGKPLPDTARTVAELDVRVEIDPETQQQAISFSGLNNRYTLRRFLGAFNDTPYWITRVPESVIPNHSDIFGEESLRLITALIRASGALQPASRTVLVRETEIRPLGLTVGASGELLFVDQLRRIFRVPQGTTEPVLVACLPGNVDPTAGIGASTQAESATFILSREELKKGRGIFHTELVKFKYEVSSPLKPTRVDSSTRFLAGTVSPKGDTLYLATQERLYAASLSKKKPRPRPIAEIDISSEPGWMLFDEHGRRLLLTDSARGRLYLVQLGSGAPRVHLVADGLGWPASVQVDPNTQALYVADTKGRQIWRLRCDAERCSAPQVFARSQEFVGPNRLAIGNDGTVWVADPAARKIFAVGPDGKIARTVSSLYAEGAR